MVNKEMRFLDNGDIRYEIVDEAARTGLANKITSPTTSGTEGQVLTIDANGNPKWDGTSFIQVTDDGQGNISMETVYGVLIDTEPTENSENLVTSGGIYDAINNISGSDSAYYITAIYDDNEDEYTIDKTFAQISNAINNNKIPILIEDLGDDDKSWYFLSDSGTDSEGVDYFNFYTIMGENYKNYYIEIKSDDTISSNYLQIPNPKNYYTKTEIDNKIGNIETLLAQI